MSIQMKLATAALAAGLGVMAMNPPGPKAKAAPAAADAELEKAIRERFSRSKIAEEKFQVRVQDGVATIEGKTGVIQRKATATRLAKLAGANSVVNRIEVSQAAKENAAGNLAAGRRRAQVKRSEAPGR